jgi:hypothetical protein
MNETPFLSAILAAQNICPHDQTGAQPGDVAPAITHVAVRRHQTYDRLSGRAADAVAPAQADNLSCVHV